MENFSTLGLPEQLLHSLKAMQFHTPTPIQSQTIPPALQGSDILGSAQTGTGKTAAYGIPLVAHVLAQPNNAALVLTPTRELAIQVLDTLRLLLGKNTDIKTALLIGGDSMPKQLRQLSAKPRIVVGTPGRINDHLERRTLSLSSTNFLVLDETDRMLDMGFSAQLQEIVRYLPEKRQTLMFSATMAAEIVKVAGSYLQDPVRIAIGSTTLPTAGITQEVLKTIESDKYGLLLELLENRQGTMIVFVKTKFGTERLAVRLRRQGHEVEAIHGDLRQAKRERVIREFRSGKCRVLVATDVAARGLDIPHIECVVNYDLPQCPEDYIHRIGRTGRAGAQGTAVSLVTGQDGGKWRMITRLMGENGAPSNVQIENRVGKPSTVAEKIVEGEAAEKPRFEPRERRERSGRSFEARPFERKNQFGEKRAFGDRKPFEGRAERAPRSERSGDAPFFGRRPNRVEDEGFERGQQRFFERTERGPKPFGDKKAFGGRPQFGERKSFGDRPQFGERKSFGDRPQFGERKSYGDRKPYGDRPARPFGERRPFGDRSQFGERKPFGDRPAFGERKPFGDRPQFGGPKPFGDRSARPFGERKPFGDRPGRFSNDRPRGPFVDALVDKGPWDRPRFERSDRPRFGSRDGAPFRKGFDKKKHADKEAE